MTKDEELEHLRAENTLLREKLAEVKEHLRKLQDQLSKDSHNSGLPPFSDLFARQPPKSKHREKQQEKRSTAWPVDGQRGRLCPDS